MAKIWYQCPVCRNLMERPPEDWNICPKCKTQFDYEDSGPGRLEELQQRWNLVVFNEMPETPPDVYTSEEKREGDENKCP